MLSTAISGNSSLSHGASQMNVPHLNPN